MNVKIFTDSVRYTCYLLPWTDINRFLKNLKTFIVHVFTEGCRLDAKFTL